MPYDEVMNKFKKGKLHSGSKKGPKVSNRKQAVAIMINEKKKADSGKEEYKPVKQGKMNTGPSSRFMRHFNL